MDDIQALNMLVDYFKLFIENSKAFTFLIDYNLNLIGCSEVYLSIWMPQFRETFINAAGKNVMTEFYQYHDQKNKIQETFDLIFKHKKTVNYLTAHFGRYAEYVYMLFECSPIINPATGNVIATSVYAYNKPPIMWAELKHKFFTNLQSLDTTNKSILKSCELEILFLLCHFETYVEIAQILSVIHNVEIGENALSKFIQRNLYPKYAVIDKYGLRKKALNLNIHKAPPLAITKTLFIDIYSS